MELKAKTFPDLKKINSLHDISRKLKSLGNRFPKIHEIVQISQDLTNCIGSITDIIASYENTIKDLKKKIYFLESQIQYHNESPALLDNNNELQKRLLKLEDSKAEIRKLKLSNKKLRSELDDLEFVYSQTLKQVKNLEKESLEKNNKILKLRHNRALVLNADGKRKTLSGSYPVLEISKPLSCDDKLRDKLWESKAQVNDIKVVNMVEIMERKCSSVMEELRKLKLENKRQAEVISSLRHKVAKKDEELEGFQKNVERHEHGTSGNTDYCCYCQQLRCKIGKLEVQLAETVEKQHEAMTRAVQLAEKNRILERELKDIDHMAMAVEEECQNKVKQNVRNVTILQEKVAEKISEIKSLQSEVVDLKAKLDKEKLMVEKLNVEKSALEKGLEDALSEKKCLTDKINHYIVIEKTLKIEAAKLQEINKSLQRQVNGIEGKLGDALGKVAKGKAQSKPKKKNATLGLPSSVSNEPGAYRQPLLKSLNMRQDSKGDYPSEFDEFGKGRLHNEANFCCGEEHKLGERNWNNSNLNSDYLRKITEMEKEIEMLRQENAGLKRGKTLTKLDENYCSSGDSLKIMLDRVERERDLALSDVSKLQTERDILRERIKLSTESQIGENSRMERILLENEERIRRLESERRELISSTGSHRANLSALEEKCDEYKSQVHNLQSELSRSATHYSQIKLLQEETERSLTEVHGRLAHTQTELNLTLNKLKEFEIANRDLENQITSLKKEKCALKSSIACTEREKDDLLISLDEKTEMCSKLQTELKNREKFISELNEKISDLQKKFEIILNEKTSRDHVVLNLEHDVQHLKEELDKCEKQREAFKRENRRLQDDLTSALKDCHIARRELDNERREVENLKRQLQQYVSEVKKAEELLFKKESERNEMLDHFRSLSLEATALESNNHTLESAMENTKVELIAANSRLMDLEQEVATRESLVNSYENQIIDLTTRVTELESKLKQESEERRRAQEDLTALRDLCSTIDEQRESLRRKASDSDAEKLHLMNEVQRLNDEFEGLNHKLAHERTVSQTLERSLSHSRQETLEHKISNKDLQAQVHQLTLKIEELSQKLESESENVHKYQSHCADLSCQVSELRREVTNVRFEKARALDINRRCRCSSKPQSDDEDTHSSAESPVSFPISSRTYTRNFEAACERELDELEKMEQSKSFRNIPPLVFLEDSDRTVSSYYSNDSTGMFLAPVLENAEESFNECIHPECTSSELSSLPDDYIFHQARNFSAKSKPNDDCLCAEILAIEPFSSVPTVERDEGSLPLEERLTSGDQLRVRFSSEPRVKSSDDYSSMCQETYVCSRTSKDSLGDRTQSSGCTCCNLNDQCEGGGQITESYEEGDLNSESALNAFNDNCCLDVDETTYSINVGTGRIGLRS